MIMCWVYLYPVNRMGTPHIELLM